MKNLLLISPSFFGYQFEIKKAFQKIGFQVYLVDDRPSNSIVGKAIIRLNKNIISSKLDDYFKAQFEKLRSIEFSNVIVLNPEAINEHWIQKLKNNYPKAKFSLYLWDSFRNKPNFPHLIKVFHKVFTFDRGDATDNSLDYLPLFYIDDFCSKLDNEQAKYDLCFIGTGHSDRARIVKTLTNNYNSVFRTNFIFLFLHSWILFYYFKWKDQNFRRLKLSDFSFNSLSLQNAALICNQSKFILDINHANQQGLTMRTIEVHGAKKKLITTNINILIEDFFHPNNICVIDRNLLELPFEFLNSDYYILDEELYQKYSIHTWIKHLI